MSRKWLSGMVALGLCMVVAAAWSPEPDPAVGAPWISLEVPANPMDETTRDAVMLVHTFYHERPAGFPVVGSAEGLVDGERRSIALELARTSRTGVFALKQQWPNRGQWVLNLGIEERSPTSLIVELGPDGGVQEGSYYSLTTKTLALRSVRVVSGEMTKERIDAVLEDLARATE